MKDLQSKVRKAFIDRFGAEPSVVIKAPGRINLIGEHTDYNLGLVLPAAIDRCIIFAFKPNNSCACRIHALDVEEFVQIKLENLEKGDQLWANYLRGILLQFQERSLLLQGFDCVFAGTIPIGSGLSSSAALDCGFIKGVSELHVHNLTDWDVVTISNQSNNNFLDIQSGILDQFSSVFGKKGQCMMMDCKTRDYNYHTLLLGDYSFVLINTNVKHETLTSGYNDRPSECKEVVRKLNAHENRVESLRDVDLSMIDKHKDKLSKKLYNRARFIVEENQRVLSFVKAMKERDNASLGNLLLESHQGLADLYEVSCDELNLLVHLAMKEEHVLGSRMMGGGFGGCTLSLIRRDEIGRVTARITSTYKKETGITPEVYQVSLEDGVQVL